MISDGSCSCRHVAGWLLRCANICVLEGAFLFFLSFLFRYISFRLDRSGSPHPLNVLILALSEEGLHKAIIFEFISAIPEHSAIHGKQCSLPVSEPRPKGGLLKLPPLVLVHSPHSFILVRYFSILLLSFTLQGINSFFLGLVQRNVLRSPTSAWGRSLQPAQC
jgi:hypothetical protein